MYIETCNTDAEHAVVYAQNDRSCPGPIETYHSCPEVAILHAKSTGGVLDQQRLVILVKKTLFCMHKTTGEGWSKYSLFILVLSTLLCMLKTTNEVCHPYRLVSLVLKSLFCMHKTTDDNWNPYRLIILLQITLFCMQKPQIRAGTHRDKLLWC